MNRRIDTDVLNRFKGHLAEEERSPATIEKYLRDVKKFCSFAGIGVEITKETVIAYSNFAVGRIATKSAISIMK